MGQEQGEAFPPSYYIERTPPISAFVDWARAAPDNDDPADDPPVLGRRVRLLSIVGPPGCGKTWFLVQLHAALAAEPGPLLVLPLLDLKQDRNPRDIWHWFTNAVNVVNARGIGYSLPQRTDSAPVLGVEVRNLCVACAAHNQIVVFVLVDGFEEIVVDRRPDIESFLAGILMADNAKLIVTRRDAQALDAYPLRCLDARDEQEVTLNPLPAPEEQIRQRLERAGQTVVNWPREPWEDELDKAIATLTPTGRITVLTGLTGHLTSNPYINARLLALKLEHPQLPPTTLKRQCLERYLERAKLTVESISILEELVRFIRKSSSTNNSFTTKPIAPQLAQLETLMVAGIVYQLYGTQRYYLDPAVAALI